jgi:hypothetical protein
VVEREVAVGGDVGFDSLPLVGLLGLDERPLRAELHAADLADLDAILQPGFLHVLAQAVDDLLAAGRQATGGGATEQAHGLAFIPLLLSDCFQFICVHRRAIA